MEIKQKMLGILREKLGSSASPLFFERAAAAIEAAGRDQGSLIAAAEKVSKMVTLFIDAKLGTVIAAKLKEEITRNFPGGA